MLPMQLGRCVFVSLMASGSLFLINGCSDRVLDEENPVDAGSGNLQGDAAPAPDTDAGTGSGHLPRVLCRPQPAWLTEGESVEIDILCAGGAGDVHGRDVVLAPLPAGASYDPDSARLTWTPALDQAAVYEITASIPHRDESALLIIGVADRWDHPDNVPIVDREAYPLEYGVPVFFLSPPPEDDDEYEPTTIVYGRRTYRAKAKQRGSSSLDYPKNSYTLKFPRSSPFSEPDRAGGFLNKHKVVLTTTFDDNSHARQRLAFELWNRLDPAHIQIQSYSAVVYIEDRFWGLYTVTDHIDGDLMESNGLPRHGNLYKAIGPDANFRLVAKDGKPKKKLHQGLEKKEGFPEEGDGKYADVHEVVRFVATSDDATFAREASLHLDLRDYLDWMIMVSFMEARDNTANNIYHYHDPGSPWRMVMWDFNASFGQSWRTTRVRSDRVRFHEAENGLFERFLASPTFSAQLAARYREALDGVLSLSSVYALLDEILHDIRAVIPRDQARWHEAYERFERWNDRNDFTSPEEEAAYIRTWIAERWAVLDEMYR
jgi:spore coat protein H